MQKKVFLSLVFYSVSIISFAQNQDTEGMGNVALWLQAKKSTILKSESPEDYYFNFNPIFSSMEEQDLVHKNILSSKYSLFLVFKSDLEEEMTLLNLKSNEVTTTISNKQLINAKNNTYKKVDSKQGMILTYLVNQERKGRNKSSLILENLSRPNTEKGYRNDVMELLYYPRIVNDFEKQKIESYLSIKYGISLLGEVDYIDSEGRKVWDVKENKGYNNRVTGIGSDKTLHLYQKQSGNAQKDGLYIGLGTIKESNIENTNTMPEKTFFIWGDNNGNVEMKSDKKVKKMKRVWKMQSTNKNHSEVLPTQIMIDKGAFYIVDNKAVAQKDNYLWLVIDRNGSEAFDYHNAEYYMQSKDQDGKVFFDNVVWDVDKNGSDTFTFITGPDFFVDYTVTESDCNLDTPGKAKLKIIGGKAPFNLEFSAPSYSESYTISDRSFLFSDLSANNYVVNASDKMLRKQKDTLTVNGLKDVSIALEPQWHLNNQNKVIIAPQVKNDENQKLTFSWRKDGAILSMEKQFTATEEGDYALVVSNESECKNELLFKVTSSNLSNDGWVFYPNPAKMDEPFMIKFNLEKESNVSVFIFDFSNKLLKSTDLGRLKESEYTETLSTIGTFLLIVTIDGKAESAKIIIR